MDITDFLLIALIILLYFFYDKIRRIIDFEYDSESQHNITSKVKHILQQTDNIQYYLKELNEHFDNHALVGELNQKLIKKNNLVKEYTHYLIRNENLSEKEASAKAKFSVFVLKDEISNIVREIESDHNDRLKQKAEKEFYSTNLLENDINNHWTVEISGKKEISPFNLFAPLYDLIVKQKIENKHFRLIKPTYDSYYTFVSNRAIANKLEELGIIERVKGRSWGDKLEWKLGILDIREIAKLIYVNREPDSDEYLEERYSDNSLDKLFIPSDSMDDIFNSI
jgi:hypothetical protein